jgi:hypothetical protein
VYLHVVWGEVEDEAFVEEDEGGGAEVVEAR